MTPKRVTEKSYPNSQTLKEGITMTSRTRSVAFKVLLVGLASLVLVFSGPVSTVLGGPSHGSQGQSGSHGTHFPTPFMVGVTALAIKEVKDCTTGAVIAPEKLMAEFVFADGAQPPFHFNQLKKIIIKAEGYQPKEITSFMTMQFSLGFIKLIFIIPLEANICLQPAPPEHCLKLQLDGVSYWVAGRNARGELVAGEQPGRVRVVGSSIQINRISQAFMPGTHFLRVDFSASDVCTVHSIHNAWVELNANVPNRVVEPDQYGPAASDMSAWIRQHGTYFFNDGLLLVQRGQILSRGMFLRTIDALESQLFDLRIVATCSDGHDRKELVYTITFGFR